jgi:putative spermidine/putrescine transport system permease protein
VDEVTGRFPRAGFLVLGLGIVYVLVPLAASVKFSLWQGHAGFSISAYTDILRDPQFRHTLWFSFQLAIETTVLTMVLMVPTVYWVHLRLPRLRPAVEIITVLPLVTPPIVLVVGLLDVFRGRAPVWFIDSPKFLVAAYVIICLPFVYRALDAGIRSVDVQTLVEAARNLGASWPNVLLRVLVPCLRTAIVNGAFLCFALVMGEFTISSILLYTKPFPVWLYQLPTNSGQVQAAVSVFSLLLVEVLLLLIGTLNLRRGANQRG